MNNYKPMHLCILLLTLLLFIASCTPAEKSCQTDSDCVAAACCHPTEAINKNYGPTCQGILCSTECQAGTIDCGQGEVKCLSGKCSVVMNE